jgi:sigma-B regulation protein RsbU (phosphoserine phosphatase)
VQYPAEAQREGIQSMLAVALMSEGKAIGALSAYTDHPYDFDEEEKRAFEMIATQAAIGLRIASLHRQILEKELLDKELEIAERVQESFLPKRTRIEGRYDICARSVSCRQIGGDFYELIEFRRDRIGVAIGDVSGKGIAASILMATTRAALRAHIESTESVGTIVSCVNRGLCRDSAPDQFVSLFYMVLEEDGTLAYTNAGHCRPLLLRGDDVEDLRIGGPVLGVGDWVTHDEGSLRLDPGNVLVLYTDGLTETFSRGGIEFGVPRLQEVVYENRNGRSEEIADRIYDEVDAHAGYRQALDDRTLVVVKAV